MIPMESPNDKRRGRRGGGPAAIDWSGLAELGAATGGAAAQLGAVVRPPLLPPAGVELPDPPPPAPPAIPVARMAVGAVAGLAVARFADFPTAPAAIAGAILGFLT